MDNRHISGNGGKIKGFVMLWHLYGWSNMVGGTISSPRKVWVVYILWSQMSSSVSDAWQNNCIMGYNFSTSFLLDASALYILYNVEPKWVLSHAIFVQWSALSTFLIEALLCLKFSLLAMTFKFGGSNKEIRVNYLGFGIIITKVYNIMFWY